MRVQSYEVTGVDRGEDGLSFVQENPVDLVVLDVNLPGIDGLETCRRLRASGFSGPVLMLTARHQLGERVSGLDAGADDYLPKPFALDELLARIRALLRAFAVDVSDDDASELRLDDLVVDRRARTATREDHAIELTKIEFDLLEFLLMNRERVMERAEIELAVWGDGEDNTSNSLEVFVSGLRKKLEVGGRSRLIHTKRGVGYVARADS